MKLELNDQSAKNVKLEKGNFVKKTPYIFTNDHSKQDEAWLMFARFEYKVSLKKVRLLLVLSNFIVLLAAGVSFFAWQAAKYDWKGSGLDKKVACHLLLDPLKDLPPLPNNDEVLVRTVHSCLEQILYLTALNLFFYWVMYGLVVAFRFGGPCETWTLVMSLPHTLMTIAWEVGVSVAVLRVISIMSNFPWEEMDNAHHHTTVATHHVHRFYLTWGPWLAISYMMAVPAQVLTISLPFCLGKLPYQRTSDVEMQDRDIRDREKAKEAEANGSGSGASEYVGAESLSDGNLTMYQCEMPAEKLARIKAQRKQPPVPSKTAGREVIETMNKAYNVPHSVKPIWRCLTHEKAHPLLEGGSSLAGGVTIFPPESGAQSGSSLAGGITISHPEYLAMEEVPDYNDFMYLPVKENRYETPPPPYNLMDPLPHMKLY